MRAASQTSHTSRAPLSSRASSASRSGASPAARSCRGWSTVLAALLGVVVGCGDPKAPPPPPPHPRPEPAPLSLHALRERLDTATFDAESCRVLERSLTAHAREQPRLPELPYNLGVLLLRCQRAAEARPHFERALASVPRFAPARLHLALLRYQAEGDAVLDATIAELWRAIEDASFRLPDGLLAIALLQARRDSLAKDAQGRTDRENAELNLLRALVLAPTWPELHTALSQHHARIARKLAHHDVPNRGRVELAIAAAANTLARSPAFAPAQDLHHRLLVERGDLGAASAPQPAAIPIRAWPWDADTTPLTVDPPPQGSPPCTPDAKGELGLRCQARAQLTRADDAAGARRIEALERAGDALLGLWADHGDAACQSESPACDEHLKHLAAAARAFERAGNLQKGLAARRRLADPRRKHGSTALSLAAQRELVERFEAIGAFGLAARSACDFGALASDDAEAARLFHRGIALHHQLGDTTALELEAERFATRWPTAAARDDHDRWIARSRLATPEWASAAEPLARIAARRTANPQPPSPGATTASQTTNPRPPSPGELALAGLLALRLDDDLTATESATHLAATLLALSSQERAALPGDVRDDAAELLIDHARHRAAPEARLPLLDLTEATDPHPVWRVRAARLAADLHSQAGRSALATEAYRRCATLAARHHVATADTTTCRTALALPQPTPSPAPSPPGAPSPFHDAPLQNLVPPLFRDFDGTIHGR